MLAKKRDLSLPYLTLVVFSGFLVFVSNFKSLSWIVPNPNISNGQNKFISPPPKIEFFSFGFQMTIADSLWIRGLQDLDYCENRSAENVCQGNTWLFSMIDSIVNLAPDYQIAYRVGALALTVLISDYRGASIIFDKGVAMYPNDLKLLNSAAYHAMIEEKNSKKAAGLLIRAAQNGGQPWFYNLAARLYTENGERDLAIELYRDLERSGVPQGVLKRMRDKIGARYLKEPTK